MIEKPIDRKLSEKLLDTIGWKILNLLQENARLSLAEIGRLVGLSAPAVRERVCRMEEEGIISGYHADVPLHEIGLPVLAFIRMQVPTEKYQRLIGFSNKSSEVLECHHLSGGDSFILKVAVSSVSKLEQIINSLSMYGSTKTSIVLSSVVKKHVVEVKPADRS
jgi:Lrp/AsnC family transcriptional regulator, leucine-responsive regulatory protein